MSTTPDGADDKVCPHATAAIGAGYNPLDPGFRADPYSFYAKARAEAPVCLGPFGFWIVTRHDDVLRVLKEPLLFSSVRTMDPPVPYPPEVLRVLEGGYPLVPGLLNNDPPAHTRVRDLFSQAFSPKRIAALEPRVRAVANELVDGFSRDGRADIVARFAYRLPLSVICELLGVPHDHAEQLKAWHDDWIRLAATLGMSLDEKIACAENLVRYQRYYADLLEDRKRSPKDDLTTALVGARLDGVTPFTMAEMVWQMMVLLSAGHETTSHLISSALYHLLSRPDQWKALDEGPERIAAAIEEVVRFEPPFPSMIRFTTAPVELGGVSLPEGARLHVYNASANRDTAQHDNPDVIDVHRPDPQRHLSFGHGVHFCIGAPLARIEGRVALDVLRTRLPNMRIAAGFKPEYAPSFILRGLLSLPLEWDVSDRT